jgi:hypothetical protein
MVSSGSIGGLLVGFVAIVSTERQSSTACCGSRNLDDLPANLPRELFFHLNRHWIDRSAVLPHLEMKVRTARGSRWSPDVCDLGSFASRRICLYGCQESGPVVPRSPPLRRQTPNRLSIAPGPRRQQSPAFRPVLPSRWVQCLELDTDAPPANVDVGRINSERRSP